MWHRIKRSPMRFVRPVFALIALGLLVWRLVRITVLFRAVASTTSVMAIQWNEPVKKAIDMLIGQSSLWAQASAILLGGLVALWLAKADEPQLSLNRRQWPEIMTWLVGAFMLLAGLYCYNEYVASVAVALEVGGVTSGAAVSIPDIFADKYDALRTEQFRLLVLGAIASALAIFSVRHLTKDLHAN